MQKTSKEMVLRVTQIAELMTGFGPRRSSIGLRYGRNLWTRTVDWGISFVRQYLPPLHWIGSATFAISLFLYVRLCAFTVRLTPSSCCRWPELPVPCVLALWHGCAPSLLVAIAARRPRAPLAIMVARDPRGDSLSLLCRLLGLRVVRGDREQGGWEALADLAGEIERGACAIITADGGGPAREAKLGAVALASATGVPLLALGADCHPALSMPHKWDAARNPIPFSRLAVSISESYHCPFSLDLSSIEHSRCSLQSMLNETFAATRFQDDH